MQPRLSREDRVSELNAFLRFCMETWPTERARHIDRLSKRCSKCFLSEAYTPLPQGVCKFCLEPAERIDPNLPSDEMHADLASCLQIHAGKGSWQHDALVLFSGGKDSAYLLHRLKTEFPDLRLLAVMVDNGFCSSIALANAAHIADQLQVDHILYRPDPDLFGRTFRYTMTHLGPGGSYATVDRFDGDLTIDIGLNMAAEMGIPLVIHGGSYAQIERILGLRTFRFPDDQLRLKRTSLAGVQFSDVYTEEQLRFWWDGTNTHKRLIPKLLFPLYVWRYDEMFLRNEVIRLGLIRPGEENPLVTNNDTIPVLLALDVAKYGFSYYEPEFAQMVREGKTDRTWWMHFFEALEFQVKQGTFAPRSIDDTLGRLSLTRHDLGIPVRTP